MLNSLIRVLVFTFIKIKTVHLSKSYITTTMAKKKEWKEGEIALAFFDKNLLQKCKAMLPTQRKYLKTKTLNN